MLFCYQPLPQTKTNAYKKDKIKKNHKTKRTCSASCNILLVSNSLNFNSSFNFLYHWWVSKSGVDYMLIKIHLVFTQATTIDIKFCLYSILVHSLYP